MNNLDNEWGMFCEISIYLYSKLIPKRNVGLMMWLHEKFSKILSQSILRGTWVSVPNLMAIHPADLKIVHWISENSTGKVLGSPKSWGFILWGKAQASTGINHLFTQSSHPTVSMFLFLLHRSYILQTRLTSQSFIQTHINSFNTFECLQII